MEENRKISLTVEELLLKLRQFGLYQKMMFGLLCIPSTIFTLTTMGIVFLAAIPDHRCKVPGLDNLNITEEELRNVSIPLEVKDGESVRSSCYMYDVNYTGWTEDDVRGYSRHQRSQLNTTKCQSGWIYDTSVFKSSFVTEYDLVCDRRFLQATGSSVYFGGILVGVFLFGTISDLFGRRKALIFSDCLAVVGTISCVFVTNYTVLLVLRFFSAVGISGFYIVTFVSLVELVGPDYRTDVGIGINYFWVLGYVGVAGIAYFVRERFTLHLITAVPILCVLFFICIVNESLPWLYMKGRQKHAKIIVRKIAKVNKVSLPETVDIVTKKSKKEETGTFLDLFRTPLMRLRSINLCFNWFVTSVAYFGLSLGASNLGGNPYLNFCISGAVEVPALMLSQILLRVVGRRLCISIALIIGGTSLLLTMAVPQDLNIIVIILSMIGKFCVTASFAMIYVFTAELYPTPIRNVGISTGSSSARIGGVVAPYVANLSVISKFIPLVIFGVLSLLAGLLTLILPETKGLTLPQTMTEAERIGGHGTIFDRCHKIKQTSSSFSVHDDGEESKKLSTDL